MTYTTHILTDLITKTGVPLFYPYKKRLKIPIISTGDMKEFVFRTIVYAGLMFIIVNYVKDEIHRLI